MRGKDVEQRELPGRIVAWAVVGLATVIVLSAGSVAGSMRAAGAQEDCGEPEPDSLIVKMHEGASEGDVAAMKEINGEGSEMLFSPPDLWVADLPLGLSVEEAVKLYEASPGVRYAGPDSMMYSEEAPSGTGCQEETETGAGLKVGLSDRPDPVFVGGTLTYEATIRNNGPDDAVNVDLESGVRAGVVLLSSSFVNGDARGSCLPEEDRVIRCRIGDLGVGETATLKMEVRPTEAGRLPNLVDAGADNALMGVESSASASTLVLGAPVTSAGPCTITGTAGNDVLRGSAGRDVVCGLGGDDLLLGEGGGDALFGGDGRDAVRGGAGPDKLFGGLGADTLRARDGVRGNDAARGGSGRDSISADRGDLVRD